RCILSRREADFALVDYAPEGDPNGDCVVNYREIEVMTRDWLLTDSNVYATAPDGANLVAHYKFEEASGTLYDESDNHNDGTAFDGVLYQQIGQEGYALGFDGIDDRVEVGDTGRPSDTFSFGGWLKTSATHQIDPESTAGVGGTAGQRYAFDPSHGGDLNAGAGLSVGTNGISVYEHGSNYMPATAVYAAEIGDDWNHIMVVYNNKQPTIYLNGEAVRTGLTCPRAIVNAPIQFGGMSYGFLEGLMDEVRIYSYALSAEEVVWTMGVVNVYTELISPANLSDNEPVNEKKVNFLDYAMLMQRWLDEDLFP
ncbi:MAG: LamG domain-containing protein, partial [Planctomycetes bacterium]|nr:LamG domain-containing protein [Planctomycetota bacterium]